MRRRSHEEPRGMYLFSFLQTAMFYACKAWSKTTLCFLSNVHIEITNIFTMLFMRGVTLHASRDIGKTANSLMDNSVLCV